MSQKIEAPLRPVNLEEIRNNPALRDEYIRNRWLNIPDLVGVEVKNPLGDITQAELDNPNEFLMKIITDIRYVYFTAKFIFNVTLSPTQVCIIQELWNHPFPMLIGSRGMSKTFMLAFYVMLKAFLRQGSKIVLTGAGFRQSKLLFEYCETIWSKADILRDILGPRGVRGMKSGPTRGIDKCEMVIGDSIITALPIGNGEKIRGLRAGTIIADEFDAIDTEIFETVIRGFAVVTDTPIENMQKSARHKALKELGFVDEENTQQMKDLFAIKTNQIVISGTASYSFKNFAKYWKRYKAYIMSRGNKRKLNDLLDGEAQNLESLDWKDFCIIRIPFDLIPEGFFEQKQIDAAKATLHSTAYQIEYGAVFVGDSEGFFKRSLVETCVTKHPIQLPSGPVQFSASVTGNKQRKYIYGVDPASERDNFALVILEVWPDHRRIVYAWTTTRKRFNDKLRKGVIQEHQFYAYCARKIRDLMRVFPCEMIAVDAGGGGLSVAEALSETVKILPDERPIWPVIDPEDPKDSDNYSGLHIIKLINFSDGKWVAEANHGMKKDMEDKNLLFPRFDAVEVELAGQLDNEYELKHGLSREDTLEDCVLEIEDLKEELATIQHSQTPNSNREHWDTPEMQMPGQKKKGRLRKDRYSALLLANMIGRSLARAPKAVEYGLYGGIVKDISRAKKDEDKANKALYSGPAWFTEKCGGGGGFGVLVRS